MIGVLAGWNLLLQGQLSAANSYERQVAAVLDVASQPGALTAVLAPAAAAGHAVSPHEPERRDGDRDARPGAHVGHAVYEAWVIGADGVPVPLGGATVGRAGTAFYATTGVAAAAGVVACADPGARSGRHRAIVDADLARDHRLRHRLAAPAAARSGSGRG